ncbi:MAG: HAMP domain-containing sensor histidine kinase [Eubacteriales bacterium]
MKELFRKQLLIAFALCMLLFCFHAIFFDYFSYAHMTGQTKNSFVSRSEAIFFSYHKTPANRIASEFTHSYALEEMAALAQLQVIILDYEGNFLYTTQELEDMEDISDDFNLTPESLPYEFYPMIETYGHYSDTIAISGFMPNMVYLSAVPFSHPDAYIEEGIILVYTYSPSASLLFDPYHFFLFSTSCLAFGISLFFIVLYAARKNDPLSRFSDAISRLAQGDLNARIVGYEGKNDEMGIFASNFNMAMSSLASIEQQRSEFISNISHELKTPMTSISGFAEGILDGHISEESRDHSLKIIATETRRLSRLVTQMLELARLDAASQNEIPPVTYDFTELLSQVIISLEARFLNRNLDLDVDMPDQPLMVSGYPDGMTQVCLNLLDNSSKFAVPGSTITVSIKVSDNKAIVSVRNLGKTIDSKELPYLFDRFHKVDRSRSINPEGLGLGLYIVKAILNHSHETITATSLDGATTFTFTLTLSH